MNNLEELKKAALGANLHGWTGFEDALNADGYSEAVSKFIGHCSPSAILALIAQLEAAHKNLDEMTDQYVDRTSALTYASIRAEKAEAALSAANEKPKLISFDELADRVQFVTGGIRMSFDPLSCKGHQIVPFMNFNSLSRIVEMYRTALQTPVVRQQHADWSNATFGNVGPVGPLKHLSKEALETAASPDDLSEWADMQFLFWDAQRRAGITDAQIEQAMIDKLEINKSRVWPEPKDGEPREHIKAGFTVKEDATPIVIVPAPAGVIMSPQFEKPLERCAAGRDGECHHKDCPQLRDNEPMATGRHCPIDNWDDE